MKIYTKNGDLGTTSLVDGSKVKKSDLRLETYGTVDELNSHLGLLISHLKSTSKFSEDIVELEAIQVWLFQLGSQLACADKSVAKQLPTIKEEQIKKLESSIDRIDAELPKIKNFILPGGHIASSQAHICRTVSRRAERTCSALNEIEPFDFPAIPFINRISDYFFTLARAINHRLNINSVEWVP